MRAVSTLALAVSASLYVGASAQSCRHPLPAVNFNQSNYGGTWYEIGKVQTWELIVTNAGTNATVLNSCRLKEPSGEFLNATGDLSDQAPPGRWVESFYGIPGVNYTVIALGDDYSVEYDCGESLFGANYCVHILSRTPTMDPAQVSKLLNFSLSLDLNPLGLPFNLTKQEGCW